MAVELTGYLSNAGEYWGFDVGARGIQWCQTHITPRFPNFHFWRSDIYNKAYNPRGKIASREFKFPYSNAYFDFAFLTSVFTHMLLPDVKHYLGEITTGRHLFGHLLPARSDRTESARQGPKRTGLYRAGTRRPHDQQINPGGGDCLPRRVDSKPLRHVRTRDQRAHSLGRLVGTGRAPVIAGPRARAQKVTTPRTVA